MLASHNRYKYSGIDTRPKYRWPGGKSLVLALSLHTFIVGQPFRIVHLRRALEHMLAHRDRLWVTLPREISRYYRTLPAEAQLQAD